MVLPAVPLLLCLAFPAPAAAQSDRDKPPSQQDEGFIVKVSKVKKGESWKNRLSFSVEGRYDDNLFLLSDGQKLALDNAGPAEAASGRFRNMNSTTDFIVTPAFEFEAYGPGAGGRRMTLKSRVQVPVYSRNPERNHLETDFSLSQKTSAAGRVRFNLDFKANYFPKNYLLEAVDGDADGSISDNERRYAGAEYNQWDVSADYRHRVAKGESVDAFLWGGVGYLKRDYRFLFNTRDRAAPHANAGLYFKGKNWSLDLNGEFAAADSPRGQEVLLLDEPDFGVDLNGDLDATDLSVRALQLVDRTHTQQTVGIDLETPAVEVNYQRRFRHYSSHETFDVAHNERTDTRDKFQVSRVFGKPSKTHARVGAFYVRQDTDRAGDPGSTGEVTDYDRLGGFFSFVIVF